MRDMHKGTGNMIHAEVHYNQDDINKARAKVSESISKNPTGTFAQMTSGATRQLAINAEATRRVPTKAGTSFKA